MARAVWRWVKRTSSWRREVPSGTDILRGARNKSWIVVTACLCSARRAIAALHPKQAHDATPVTNTAHLKLFQCANGPGKRKEWRSTCWVDVGIFLCFWRKRARCDLHSLIFCSFPLCFLCSMPDNTKLSFFLLLLQNAQKLRKHFI